MAPCPCCRRDLPRTPPPGSGRGRVHDEGHGLRARDPAAAGRLRAGEVRADALAEEVRRLGARRVMVDRIRPGAAVPAGTAGLPEAVRWREVANMFRSRWPSGPAGGRARARRRRPWSASVAAPTTGLAKAVALTTGLPIVAVPTTYAGSEATDVWGLTEARPQDHRASTCGCCRARSSTTPA